MASDVKRWLAGVGFLCLAIVLAYVPPRGSAGRARRNGGGSPPAAPLSSKRVRANALAWEWRVADRAVRLAELRAALRPLIVAQRAADEARPVVWFEGPVDNAVRPAIAARLDSLWDALLLGTPKISVAVVISAPTPPPRAGATTGGRFPTRETSNSPAYLFPDSTDRTTCVALVPLGVWSRQQDQIPRQQRFAETLRAGLGLCAYYAALGAPGVSVGRWLRARHFDLATAVEWDRPAGARRAGWFGPDAAASPWFWRLIYDMPPDAVACLGGRADRCKQAVLVGADGRGSAAASGTFDMNRWWRRLSLFGAEWYVSDLMRSFGRDRVARLWATDLPVDSAFRVTMGTDIGDWTRRWQAAQLPPVPIGPRPTFGATVVGLLLIGAALSATARVATRRRVG